MPEKPDPIDALAYTTAQAAAVTGRSHTRIKKSNSRGGIDRTQGWPRHAHRARRAAAVARRPAHHRS